MARNGIRWQAIVGAGMVLLAVVTCLGPVGIAEGDSSGTLRADATAPDGSAIDGVTAVDDRHVRLSVYSAAMSRPIIVEVQRPADPSRPAPVLYLLNGADGGEGTANWDHRAPAALDFLATKDVNVVQPIGGLTSYYTDWRAPDPVLGVNKWKTFLTEELPPLIDSALNTTGDNAIAGLSTSGTSVLQLAIARPGLYRSVAAYSGCAQISDPLGYQFVKLVVGQGQGDTANMYGPQDDPMWADNDPYVHADQLRGLNLYLSSGSGLPGPHDTLDGPYTLPGLEGLANQVTVGGVLEAATDYCTHNMQTRLAALGIPATFDFPPTGTHSWGYWYDALVNSWPVLARGLEL
ncbi:alpha/beta hydrolase [Nocardia sp. NPDC004722]